MDISYAYKLTQKVNQKVKKLELYTKHYERTLVLLVVVSATGSCQAIIPESFDVTF